MHKAEKFHIPGKNLSEDTKTFFMKNFGCSRKVKNLYVDFLYSKLEEINYKTGDPIPDIKLPEVSEFKKQFPYLKEADSLGLANAKIDIEESIKRYNKQYDHTTYTKRALRRAGSGMEELTFRRLKGMPKFRSKARGDFSYTTDCQYPSDKKSLKQPTIRLNGGFIHLPKLKSDIKITMHRPLPINAVINKVTVSMENGEFYVSVNYTYTIPVEMSIREAAMNGDIKYIDKLKFIGLDYSQQDFYIDSYGRKANCPHAYKKSEDKLARYQRQLSRMEKGSNNYERKLTQIKRLYVKMKNQRKDFVFKEAAYLTLVYDVVVVEGIDLRAMGGALSLGKNLHDNGFGMFRTQLSHLLERKGSVLVKVPRSYASTKTCSHCGYVNQDVILGVSDWICPQCGTMHNRDKNAAVNIETKGREIFAEYFTGWLQKDDGKRGRAQKLSNARKQKQKAA